MSASVVHVVICVLIIHFFIHLIIYVFVDLCTYLLFVSLFIYCFVYVFTSSEIAPFVIFCCFRSPLFSANQATDIVVLLGS